MFVASMILVLVCDTAQADGRIEQASKPTPFVAGIETSPTVGGVTTVQGLREVPRAPDQFAPPSGDGRLWLGEDGRFCLVIEHTLPELLSARSQELATLGKLEWHPGPSAHQMLTAEGQWQRDDSHSPPDLMLTGTVSWYPVFSPPKSGASLTDHPCDVAAHYGKDVTPSWGPGKLSEVLRLSPDPTREPSSGAKVEYLMVQTPVGSRRLPYLGFEL